MSINNMHPISQIQIDRKPRLVELLDGTPIYFNLTDDEFDSYQVILRVFRSVSHYQSSLPSIQSTGDCCRLSTEPLHSNSQSHKKVKN